MIYNIQYMYMCIHTSGASRVARARVGPYTTENMDYRIYQVHSFMQYSQILVSTTFIYPINHNIFSFKLLHTAHTPGPLPGYLLYYKNQQNKLKYTAKAHLTSI